MVKFGRSLLLPLLLGCLLTASVGRSFAQLKELPVYNEWQGRNSSFKADRPFFLIRDIYDLNRFWEKSGANEPAPGIDFAKFMLLVWCPGSSLFDFVPVRVERFLYKEGNYFALLEFERKDTGGFWRNPFMATMLPMVTAGDIFIMRKVVIDAHKVDWKPVYTIWDMSGERQRPFEVAHLEQPPATVELIAHSPEPPEKAASTTTDSGSTTETVASTINTTSTQSGTTPRTQPVAQTTNTVSGASNAQSSAISAWPDVKPVSTNSQQTVTQPVQKIDEDPLFGTEFDITF